MNEKPIKIDGINFGRTIEAIFLRDLLHFCKHGTTVEIRDAAIKLYSEISKHLQYVDKIERVSKLK